MSERAGIKKDGLCWELSGRWVWEFGLIWRVRYYWRSLTSVQEGNCACSQTKKWCVYIYSLAPVAPVCAYSHMKAVERNPRQA
jgi:hypothetical protein